MHCASGILEETLGMRHAIGGIGRHTTNSISDLIASGLSWRRENSIQRIGSSRREVRRAESIHSGVERAAECASHDPGGLR
jgi:hypothetical protein